MSKSESTDARRVRRSGGAVPRGRRRHRGRWTAIALALAVPALVGPYLLFMRDDSEAVPVDAAAYCQFVSVHSGNALDVAGADNADGVRIQQEKRAASAASQQWRLKRSGAASPRPDETAKISPGPCRSAGRPFDL